MKKINFVLILISSLFILSSCEVKEWFYDVDTTDSISQVSVKPILQIVGEPIMSLPVNSTYVEQGVLASEVEEGGNDLTAEIVRGSVNTGTAGCYIVAYKAINTFGWATTVYRAVLVYATEPDTYTDISGEYKQLITFGKYMYMNVTKHEVKGFWNVSNFYTSDSPMEGIMADLGNNTYVLVPKSIKFNDIVRVEGTAEFVSNKLKFTVIFYDKSDVASEPQTPLGNFLTWTKM